MANYITQENLTTYNTQIRTYINDQDKKVVAAAKNYVNTELGNITPSSIGAETAGAATTAETNAKAYTDTKVADLVDSAPETMDTLKELADAIKNNGDAVTAINTAIATKADKTELFSGSYNDLTDKPAPVAATDVYDATSSDAMSGKAVASAIAGLQANFQAGVDSVYDALVAKGATPDSKSLSDIINCINNVSIVPPLPAGLYDADGNMLAELSVSQIEQDSTGYLIPSSWIA